MEVEILIFADDFRTLSRRVELDNFQHTMVAELKQSYKLAVCLIDSSSLTELQKNISGFVYKGLKHPKKQLTYYFKAKNERVEFIDGSNYKVYSQLKRSIHDFLKNEAELNCTAVFFICISESLFKNAKEEIASVTQYSEVKNGRYKNPLLNLMNSPHTKIDLKNRYIGNSEPCLLVRQMISVASQNDFPVLILGESGTGKEVVARNIHECSKRAGKPFIAINCGAIPTELFESELFGYLKGSSSIAFKDKKGLWEVANNGTLFLDEIGDLSLNHQAKILRALTEEEILPVGGTRGIKMNVRIIAATNKNIDVLATDKTNGFREDLYYRISTFIIRTPPLSSHPEDIPALAEKTWDDLCNKRLSADVLNQLKYINWPGNVRSLKHFLQRLYAIFGNEPITEEHIHVLQYQDFEKFLNLPRDIQNSGAPVGGKNPEKTIMKIEYLLKASVYIEDKTKRRELLDNVRECLEELY